MVTPGFFCLNTCRNIFCIKFRYFGEKISGRFCHRSKNTVKFGQNMYIKELSGELRTHTTEWKHENIYLKQASYKERHARNTELGK